MYVKDVKDWNIHTHFKYRVYHVEDVKIVSAVMPKMSKLEHHNCVY